MAKTMKIKVSKVFAKFITESLKAKGITCVEEVSVCNLSERAYALNVGDIYDAEDHGDYDYTSGSYKAIRVLYQANCYACPLYLSTKSLLAEFRRNNISNIDGLRDMVCDMIEI